jgi:hypothetical protein
MKLKYLVFCAVALAVGAAGWLGGRHSALPAHAAGDVDGCTDGCADPACKEDHGKAAVPACTDAGCKEDHGKAAVPACTDAGCTEDHGKTAVPACADAGCTEDHGKAAVPACADAGCKEDHGKETAAEHDHAGETEAERAAEAAAAVVEIAAPESVRRNLGITFVTAEKRVVSNTLRTAGRFELQPEARRSYGVPLAGFVTPCVVPLQDVKAGQILFKIRSPELVRLGKAVDTVKADLAAAEAAVVLMRRRLESLEQAGSRNAALELELGLKEGEVKRLKSTVAVSEQLQQAATAGTSIDDKTGELCVAAMATGRVEKYSLTPGAWGETGAEVLTIIQPTALRFSASVSLGDAGRIAAGLPARIVPVQGSGTGLQEGVDGRLMLGLEADPATRSLPVYVVPATLPAWARSGVPAYLEILTGGGQPVVAVPRGCVLRDGLKSVVFVRDPKNPDRIVRAEIELGPDDGRWIAATGIEAGASVVLDGAYELKLSTSGQQKKAGHFHADGVFCEGKHK